MNYGKSFILLMTLMPAVLADTDYCDANLCDVGKEHIACGNDGTFAHICERPEIIKITRFYRRQIIRKHNSLRNEIAKGFENLPPAKRMATMLWDNELATLAGLNVKQCEMQYDECRNTPRYPFAAQNIASWKIINISVSEVIDSQIQEWFNEYRNCSLHVITGYISSNGPPYGHFTNMVQERSNRVGCAILRSISLGYEQHIMTCNYAYGNMLGKPVYTPGKTASQCVTGTNSRFNALCSVLEKYEYVI